jgi:hypothetical protein
MSKDIKEPKLKSEGEIREEIIKEYELDADNEGNQKFISKLTSERLETQKKISTAIGQKIKIRDGKDFYKKVLEDAKLDPKTGKPLEEKKPDNQEDKFVTKEEFARTQLRQEHSYMNDDEFSFVEAFAKGNNVDFKKALDNPIVKEHFENIDVNSRIAGATGAPSGRFKKSENEDDKISKEFDRDLPIGFSSKKN